MNKNILIEDSIAIKDSIMGCGSKMLDKYVSPYSSTLVLRLKEYDYQVFKSPKELGLWESVKYDIDIDGGLIGVDTVGELLYGINSNYGFKPSKNSVSMYGVNKGTSTYDNVAILSDDIETIKDIYTSISGDDKKDLKTNNYKNIKLSDEIKIVDFENIKINYLEYLENIFTVLSSVEYSSNTTRFDGINYGKSSKDSIENIDDIYLKTRGKYLTTEAKAKILQGYYFLSTENRDKYYNTSLKLSSAIKEEVDSLLDNSTLLMSKSDINNIDNSLILLASMLGLPVFVWRENNEIITLVGPKYSDESLVKLVQQGEVL